MVITPPINPVLNALAGAAQVRPQEATPAAAPTIIRRAAKPAEASEKVWRKSQWEREEERQEDIDQANQHRLDLSV
ncbi:hypothetical protein ACFSM5_02250 [Lacibacterium aquatile]|uniref:Uncharacterized protein n=1 Tax=Lacibacterium aquatile TaxID=1168082 RepID=A0ABW5DP70_9PROT